MIGNAINSAIMITFLFSVTDTPFARLPAELLEAHFVSARSAVDLSVI
jgi:hypothetical protein